MENIKLRATRGFDKQVVRSLIRTRTGSAAVSTLSWWAPGSSSISNDAHFAHLDRSKRRKDFVLAEVVAYR